MSGPPGKYPGNDGPLAGSSTMGARGWKTKREADAAFVELKRKADEILGGVASAESGGKTVLYSRRGSTSPATSQATPQTETPAFKRWFGDSKVVDAEGKPLVVYHGTHSDVQAFTGDKVKSRFPNSEGFYFTTSPFHASVYADSINNAAEEFDPTSRFIKPAAEGGNVMPAYVSLQNPKLITVSEWGTLESAVDGDGGARVRAAREAGHDGVIVTRNAGDRYDGKLVIAFRPEQIKSAIGNRGTYDPNDPSILNQGPSKVDTLTEAAPAAQPPSSALLRDELIALRKREAVLESLLNCL